MELSEAPITAQSRRSSKCNASPPAGVFTGSRIQQITEEKEEFSFEIVVQMETAPDLSFTDKTAATKKSDNRRERIFVLILLFVIAVKEDKSSSYVTFCLAADLVFSPPLSWFNSEILVTHFQQLLKDFHSRCKNQAVCISCFKGPL